MDLRKLVRESVEAAYVDRFGDLRVTRKNRYGWMSPIETFESNVKGALVDILCETEGVSEKDFTAYRQAEREVRRFFEKSPGARAALDDLKAMNVRPRYAAEVLFKRWHELDGLRDDEGLARMNEAKKTERQRLRDNQVKLTDEERAEVITKGATWDDGLPGVWKSVDKNGNVQYCSNTHRAMAVSKTLAAAIKKFPEIKATS